MPLLVRAAGVVFGIVLVASFGQAPAAGSGLQAGPAPQATASGKDVLTRKCFQCHQASMWASSRGDRKEWLGVLYRMVGRGALWTEDEINAMATFLAETRPATPNSQDANSQNANPKAP